MNRRPSVAEEISDRYGPLHRLFGSIAGHPGVAELKARHPDAVRSAAMDEPRGWGVWDFLAEGDVLDMVNYDPLLRREFHRAVVLATDNVQWFSEHRDLDEFAPAVRAVFPDMAISAHKVAGLTFEAMGDLTGLTATGTWRWVHQKKIPRGDGLLAACQALLTLGLPTIKQIEDSVIKDAEDLERRLLARRSPGPDRLDPHHCWVDVIRTLAADAWNTRPNPEEVDRLRQRFDAALNNDVLDVHQARILMMLVENPHLIDDLDAALSRPDPYHAIRTALNKEKTK